MNWAFFPEPKVALTKENVINQVREMQQNCSSPVMMNRRYAMVAAEVAMLWKQLEFANRLFKISGMGENQKKMKVI